MRSQQDSWKKIPRSQRRPNGPAYVREVALDNLRAMCGHVELASEGEVSFTVLFPARAMTRVVVRVTDPTGTVEAAFKIKASVWGQDDATNPRVFLEVLRIGEGRDAKVRAQFEPLLTCPTLWRSPESGTWRTHGEIRVAGDDRGRADHDTCTFCDIPGGNHTPPSDPDEARPPEALLAGQDPASPIDPGALRQMRQRGGAWHAYVNQDLSSGNCGHLQFLTCGDGCTHGTPPEAMPDTSAGLGWRYRYQGLVDTTTGLISERQLSTQGRTHA